MECIAREDSLSNDHVATHGTSHAGPALGATVIHMGLECTMWLAVVDCMLLLYAAFWLSLVLQNEAAVSGPAASTATRNKVLGGPLSTLGLGFARLPEPQQQQHQAQLLALVGPQLPHLNDRALRKKLLQEPRDKLAHAQEYREKLLEALGGIRGAAAAAGGAGGWATCRWELAGWQRVTAGAVYIWHQEQESNTSCSCSSSSSWKVWEQASQGANCNGSPYELGSVWGQSERWYKAFYWCAPTT